MKILLSPLFAGLAFMAGCATVPNDAPDELKTADAAVSHAKDINAAREMPVTVKGAATKLDHSVALFKDSKDAKADDGSQKDLLDRSISEAKDARTMAENAAAVHDDVAAWDQDASGYLAMKDGDKALSDAQAEIARLRSTKGDANTATADGPTFNFAQPVAFFDTAEANLGNAVTPQLGALVKMLTDNRDVRINLIGYADIRGDASFNDTLSQNRAEAVAKYLEDHGVSSNRITIEHRGSSDATAQAGDGNKLQLDRRVDAQFNAVAH